VQKGNLSSEEIEDQDFGRRVIHDPELQDRCGIERIRIGLDLDERILGGGGAGQQPERAPVRS
jgi:hypothetical protein